MGKRYQIQRPVQMPTMWSRMESTRWKVLLAQRVASIGTTRSIICVDGE